ncbi:MAG: hypothetical protein IJM33_06775 [Bacteroidales bacterium]|nr:hypothetical protein [Bacteroidales bacterium]
MPRQLDKAAVKKLLRKPDTKVFRNRSLHIALLVTLAFLFIVWDVALFFPDDTAVATIIIVLTVQVASLAGYWFWGRCSVLALTPEGMYLSRANTEDFRSPLTYSRLFVRWDELTMLKLENGPTMTFKVKEGRYAYTVSDDIISSRTRAKKHRPLVEAICSYSGYRYYFQQGVGLTWQYIFVSPSSSSDFEVVDSDWGL